MRLADNMERLTYRFVEGQRQIAPEDIVYIENDLHRAAFHLRDGRVYHIYQKLSDLEKELAPYGFLRAHQSFLVNIGDMREFKNYRLTLNDGTELPVPRSRVQAVKRALLGQ